MRMCDLHTSQGRLIRATKHLKEVWAQTKTHWNDSTSVRFEETFLRQLGPEVHLVVAAIHRLADVLEHAETECQDHEQGK